MSLERNGPPPSVAGGITHSRPGLDPPCASRGDARGSGQGGDFIRVAVTGLGVVSPVGNGAEAFFQALLAGTCGIRRLSVIDPAPFAAQLAGEVDVPVLDGLLGERFAGDRAMAIAAGAALEAWLDAGLDKAQARRTAVVTASNFGSVARAEAVLGGQAAPGARERAALALHPATDLLAGTFSLGGPRATLSLSCSAGAAALAVGLDLIRAGRCDACLCGGYDAISRFAWSGLCALRTMAKDTLRPFDRRRDGTIFSEGAGFVVLERLDLARARGARVHAELAGQGMDNNAFHMTASPDGGEGLAQAMRAALADAGLDPAEVDHVNAHGTGTRQNDVSETLAIKSVFGPRAKDLAVNAIKSMTGHACGGAGALEAVATVLSLREGAVPPTINCGEQDPACDLDCTVSGAVRRPLRAAMSNSAGIGGCNAVLAFRRAGA